MNKRLFIIDAVLIILLAASGISGIMIWSSIIPRRNPLRRKARDFHLWSGLTFFCAALYHLSVHWGWFLRTGRKIIIKEKQPI